MIKKSIIIIGGGLGGLSTGIYALMNDYNVTIFEKNAVPGGLAACWRRKDYLIDGGIHFIAGYKPGLSLHRVFKEVGAHKADYVDLDVYARYIDEISNRSIDISGDLDQFQKDLLTLFPKDKRIIKHFIKGTRGMAKSDISEFGFRKPIELMKIKDWIIEFWNNRKSLRYFLGRSMREVKNYTENIKDPMLKELFLYMFLPDVPVAFLWMVLSFLYQKQLGVLKNGSLDFSKKLEDRFIELGGVIKYKSKVDNILIKNDRAVGIILEDGSAFNSDFVISAIDGYTVIFEMLEGKYVNENIKNRYENWKFITPFICVSFGIKMEFNNEVWMTFFKTKDSIRVANEDKNQVMIRFFNYSSSFAPKGKSVIQIDLETEWEYWFELSKDKKKYNKEKKILVDQLIKWLEKRYPGITEKIEVTDVATPYTFWRYTLNKEGSYMGFLPTAKSFSAKVEKELPGLDCFYMAGQWAMSMGGVQPVIYSGRHLIELLCNKEGKPFKTNN